MTSGTSSTTLKGHIDNICHEIGCLESVIPDSRSQDLVTSTEYLSDIPEEDLGPLLSFSTELPAQYEDVKERLAAAMRRLEYPIMRLQQQMKDLEHLKGQVEEHGRRNAEAISLRSRLTAAIASHDTFTISAIKEEVETLDGNMRIDEPTKRLIQSMLTQIGQALAATRQPAVEEKKTPPSSPRLAAAPRPSTSPTTASDWKELGEWIRLTNAALSAIPQFQPKERTPPASPRATTAPLPSAPQIDISAADDSYSSSSSDDEGPANPPSAPNISGPLRLVRPSASDPHPLRVAQPLYLQDKRFPVFLELEQVIHFLGKKSEAGFDEAISFIIEKNLNDEPFKVLQAITEQLFHIHGGTSADPEYGMKAFQSVQTPPEDKLRAAQQILVMVILRFLTDAAMFNDQESVNRSLDILNRQNLDPRDLPSGKANMTHVLYGKLYDIYKAEAERSSGPLIHPHDSAFRGDFGRHAFRGDVDPTARISMHFVRQAIEQVIEDLMRNVWKIQTKK